MRATIVFWIFAMALLGGVTPLSAATVSGPSFAAAPRFMAVTPNTLRFPRLQPAREPGQDSTRTPRGQKKSRKP